MALTDVKCRGTKPGKTRQKLSDGGGLQFWVQPNGSRLWQLVYQYQGKQAQMALGPYPQVSLIEARARREEVKAKIRAGIDPTVEKRQVEAAAHMVVPTGNWRVCADPQRANSKAIGDSIAHSPAQAAFAAEEQVVHRLLGWSKDERSSTAEVFGKLLTLTETEVQRIATFFMAATLEAGGEVVEDVGASLRVDARRVWQPDDCFLDLVRDRATLNAMVAEVAGPEVAAANVAEKAKTQRQVIQNCLTGSGGRQKVMDWLPGWMAFPARSIGESVAPTDGTRDEADLEPDRIAAE